MQAGHLLKIFPLGIIALGCIIVSSPAIADPGLYIGASAGGSDISFEVIDDITGEPVVLDDDQLAYKVFAGYRFNTDSVDLAIEGGYVDLSDGQVFIFFPDFTLRDVDVTGWDVFGVLGANAGPFGIFGKAGLVWWDASASIRDVGTIDDNGVDLAYGIGVRANLGPFEFRIEYEEFDIDATDDASLTSLGFVWNF